MTSNIAETILLQLGGADRLAVMIGASHFVNRGRALSFRFSGARERGNYIEIALANDDTYEIKAKWMTRNYDVLDVRSTSGIHAAQLIECVESITGQAIRL